MFKRWLKLPKNRSFLLLGARRAGKTTLLKALYPDFHYTTLDDFDYLMWVRKDPKGFILKSNRMIIDEIQREPSLTISVKYAIDNLNACIIMTGSSTIGLSDSAAESLAGRISIHSLPTLCWGEEIGVPTHTLFSLDVSPIQIQEASRNFDKAVTYGHFPEIVQFDEDSKKIETLKIYRESYFLRDTMLHSNIENYQGMNAIFFNIAHSCGSHLEISNFAREAGLSYPTTNKYLTVLNQSQLIFKLYGYQYGPAKKFIKSAKTYFSDVSILTAIKAKINEGQIIENFVIAELEKRRKLGLLKTDQLYHYKSTTGNEIDCVFESEQFLYLIEIKRTIKPVRKDIKNLTNFIPKKRTGKNIKRILFYMGLEFFTIESVDIIPIFSLFRAGGVEE